MRPRIARLDARCHELGWHLDFLTPGWLTEELLPVFATMSVFLQPRAHGHVQGRGGPAQPGFRSCSTSCARRRPRWVKLTGTYRMATPPAYADAAPMARALIEAAPNRLIWGSDYPHLSFADKVGSVQLFNLLADWARPGRAAQDPGRQSRDAFRFLVLGLRRPAYPIRDRDLRGERRACAVASNSDTQLSAAIDKNWARQVEWLKTLVSFPSLRGEEAPCQDWIAREFASRGWAVDRYTLGRRRRWSTLPGFSPVMDTDYTQRRAGGGEPARAEASRPLPDHAGPCRCRADRPARHVVSRRRSSPTIKDGRMYGRGANDMKSGVCAMVFALDALRDAGYLPGSDVYVQTVTEEESTGNGALSTLARGYRADACLIPEPTGARILRGTVGVMWFRLRIRGKPVHVSESERGTNAILSAFGLIEALRGHTRELNERVKRHPWFSRIPNPIKFNPGKIAGGDWASSTPAWCEVDCRIAVLPGMSLAHSARS